MFYNVYPGTCISKSFSYPSTATYNFRWDRETFCDYMYGLIYAVAENSDLFNKIFYQTTSIVTTCISKLKVMKCSNFDI